MMKKNLIVGVFIGLSLMLVTGSLAISAEESADLENVDQVCADVVIAKGKDLLDQYNTVLYEYFNKNVPSSNQVEQAMKFYRYVEDVMYETYADAVGASNKRTFEEYMDDTAVCVKERDDVIEQAALLLQSYVRRAVSTKQTTTMADAMNDINNNMENFSMDFHSTFPALFNEMSNALPCYAQKCISK